ncbi:MAG: patatin-like phospholipase family protein [Bdellovibrionales bacterium]|nr:patatin-like phospholipase family protein [Bdellovibrionales bacterium]
MVGISLSGGGARGAYQAGVLLGLSEIYKDHVGTGVFPAPYLSGLSAGAINAAFLAATPGDFSEGASALAALWKNLTPQQVYRSDAVSMGKIGFGWIRDVSFGSMFEKKIARELLDVRPLLKLLREHIDFSNIQKNIDRGHLKALSCSAFSYNEQKTVTFLQAHPSIKDWSRPDRYSKTVEMDVKHLMASSAIPILFSPIQVEDQYYGDGAVRNGAPISPTIHMGCENIIFVGVRYMGPSRFQSFETFPSVATVGGTLLNGLFFDTLDMDLRRLRHINEIVAQTEKLRGRERSKHINFMLIRPSKDLTEIAMDHSAQGLPSIVKYLLRGLGDERDSAELASYLLFDSSFTEKLVEIGYEDALRERQKLNLFWESANSQ